VDIIVTVHGDWATSLTGAIKQAAISNSAHKHPRLARDMLISRYIPRNGMRMPPVNRKSFCFVSLVLVPFLSNEAL
jgi:hypothetical protein